MKIPPKYKHIFNTITKNTFEFNGNITNKASKPTTNNTKSIIGYKFQTKSNKKPIFFLPNSTMKIATKVMKIRIYHQIQRVDNKEQNL